MTNGRGCSAGIGALDPVRFVDYEALANARCAEVVLFLNQAMKHWFLEDGSSLPRVIELLDESHSGKLRVLHNADDAAFAWSRQMRSA